MEQKQYRLSYLPLFYDDLLETINYIAIKLENKQAAEELLSMTEDAIKKRLKAPESFEKHKSLKERKYSYYRIYVKSYIVFYVVIPDENESNFATMEVRRFLYNRRNMKRLI